jgi:hypothetical protein
MSVAKAQNALGYMTCVNLYFELHAILQLFGDNGRTSELNLKMK